VAADGLLRVLLERPRRNFMRYNIMI